MPLGIGVSGHFSHVCIEICGKILSWRMWQMQSESYRWGSRWYHSRSSLPNTNSAISAVSKTFNYGHNIKVSSTGQVDQLEDRYIGIVEAASSNLALSTTTPYPDRRKMDSVTVHPWTTMSSLRCLWPCWVSFCCRIPPWSWCSHVPSISTPIQCQRHCPDISIRTSCGTCGGRISRLDRTVERTGGRSHTVLT